MSRPDLDEMAQAALAGGSPEMNRLLDHLRPLVCRWALVWTGSPDLAEDVAQTVLLNVHRSLPRYTPTGKLTTWVYRMTRNAVVDVERKADRERSGRRELTNQFLVSRLEGRPDALQLIAAADELRHFLDALSPRQRAVIDLIELQGFSPADAAAMLEISPATIRVHLHRAKAAIGEAGRADESRADESRADTGRAARRMG